MKCLTIYQPYAHLIVTGEKRIENRTWPTGYRGPLLIHAGKSKGWLELNDAGTQDISYGIDVRDMAFGAIVGIAELRACFEFLGQNEPRFAPSSDLDWVRTHEHASGPWCWVLTNVRRFRQPIPQRGAQGLFEVFNPALDAAFDSVIFVNPSPNPGATP